MNENMTRHIPSSLIKILFFLSVLFSGYKGYTVPPQPDKIFVHLDNSFYVSGETIHYKIYFLNKEKIESKVVHVELIGANDSISLDQINLVTNNTASGKFKLPISFKEGNYLFRCYTLWNINFGHEYIFYKEIPIYNESLTGNPVDQNIDHYKKDSLLYSANGYGQINIEIMNDGPVYTGDSVYLKVSVKDNASASFSVSVFDLNLVKPMNLDEYDNCLSDLKKGNDSEIEIRYNPEKSILIQGKVLEQGTDEPITSSVLSVFNVHDVNFTRIKSKKGDFSFELPLFNGTASLQVINMNPYQEKVPVVITRTIISDIKNQPTFPHVAERTEEVQKYLYFSKLRRHIDEVFYQNPIDSLHLMTNQYLQFEPDKSYDMEKYRYIKNMEDFIRQAVSNATTYKEEDTRKLKLFNNETKKYFMTKPWLLVDNYFVFDDSLVYNIPFNQLKRIDIFNTNQSIFKYFEPIMVQGGIIAVYTKNNFLSNHVGASPNMLMINGLPLDNNENYDDSFTGAPDLEPIIFWEPDLSNEGGDSVHLSFQTSDITGACMIQVMGLGADGQLIEGNMVYQVSERIE